MWVVRCAITGEYILNSQSKAALENKTDSKYAKIYSSLSGAKSARGNIQSLYDYWHGSHLTPCDMGYAEYIAHGKNYMLRNFEVIEVTVNLN